MPRNSLKWTRWYNNFGLRLLTKARKCRCKQRSLTLNRANYINNLLLWRRISRLSRTKSSMLSKRVNKCWMKWKGTKNDANSSRLRLSNYDALQMANCSILKSLSFPRKTIKISNKLRMCMRRKCTKLMRRSPKSHFKSKISKTIWLDWEKKIEFCSIN